MEGLTSLGVRAFNELLRVACGVVVAWWLVARVVVVSAPESPIKDVSVARVMVALASVVIVVVVSVLVVRAGLLG